MGDIRGDIIGLSNMSTTNGSKLLRLLPLDERSCKRQLISRAPWVVSTTANSFSPTSESAETDVRSLFLSFLDS